MSNEIEHPTPEELDAFFDAQLPAARRAAVEAHVSGCDPCSTYLSRLGQLSRWLVSMPPQRMSNIAKHRLQAGVDARLGGALLDRGFLRIAWTMSGLAASVLVAGAVLLTQTRPKRELEAPPPWVKIAAVSDAESGIHDSGSPAAQWYLADANVRSEEAAW
jgi:anti-sigma factor RsiW